LPSSLWLWAIKYLHTRTDLGDPKSAEPNKEILKSQEGLTSLPAETIPKLDFAAWRRRRLSRLCRKTPFSNAHTKL
jgi:hypothetical protein